MSDLQLERRMEHIHEKQELLQLTVVSNTGRIEALDKKINWLEGEVVRGREMIAHDLKEINVSLKQLHEERLVRKGMEKNENKHIEFRKWFFPVLISFCGLMVLIWNATH